jgi:sigma-E factor negative regulatory protein RseA
MAIANTEVGIERLSAFMDGELPDGEVSGILAACRAQNDLGAEWSVYHCIGDVLRSQDMGCHSDRLARRISDSLAAEPYLLATDAIRVAAVRGTHRWRRPASAVAAIAAVVAVAGLIVPRWTADQAQMTAAAPTPAKATAASGTADGVAQLRPGAASQAVANGVPREFIAAHRQYTGSLAMQGMVSRVSDVSQDSGR